MTQPSNIFIRVYWLCQWDAGWVCQEGQLWCWDMPYCQKRAKYANTGPQQKTKGNTVSCVNLSTIYSTIGGHARSNGFVSGKRRGTLWNLRSSDLAGNNQQEGSWKRWKRSPKNWWLIAMITARMKVTMMHQMEEVKRSSMVIRDDDQWQRLLCCDIPYLVCFKWWTAW